LIIDTATDYIFLALAFGSEEIDSIYELGVNNHSVTIIPFLEDMLSKAKIKLRDIDQVIVGIGPGSYTGVRIGVTVAKMIGYLNNVDVYTVSSLAFLASSSNSKYVLAMIDARRGNAFMGLYGNCNNNMKIINSDVLQNIDDFKKSLDLDYEVIQLGKPKIDKILESKLLSKVDNIHDLVPNYLQITEAERNLRNEI
jgi:tRNA threonylcarbamoyladenosine biosynthesis protein TsaB